MPDLWMPGVERHDTGRRLRMQGQYGARLFTWHTFEAPYSLTMNAAWRYLRSQKSDPHFVFHPITGELVQMLPANTGGRTLRASGASTNTWGSVHMQVEVIAYARNPWTDDLTDAGRETLGRLLDYLRSWGIPDQWCHNVRPPKYPGGYVKRIQPRQSGHFHHAGWIVNDHGDPGAIADPWREVGPPKPVSPPWETPRHITAVQSLLNAVTAAGLTVDGIRGPVTEAATLTYQTDYRDDLTRDGSPGPATLAALQEDDMTIKQIAAEQARQTDLIARIDRRLHDHMKRTETVPLHPKTAAVMGAEDGKVLDAAHAADITLRNATRAHANTVGLEAAILELARQLNADPDRIRAAVDAAQED